MRKRRHINSRHAHIPMETLQSVVDAIPEQGTITEVVADKLGISVAFANTLMTRCMRKGMITREYNGEYFIYHAA